MKRSIYNIFICIFLISFFDSKNSFAQEPAVAAEADPAAGSPVASCQAANAKVLKYCTFGTNPEMISAMASIGGLLGSFTAAGSAKDKCEGGVDLGALASGGFGAFIAGCGAMKLYCQKTCTSAKERLEIEKEAYLADQNVKDREYNPQIAEVTTLQAACEGTAALNLAAGAGNLANSVKSMMDSGECEKDLTGNKSSLIDAMAQTDCSKAENLNSKFCSCAITPTLAGCDKIDKGFVRIADKIRGTASTPKTLVTPNDLSALMGGDGLTDSLAGSDKNSPSGFAAPGSPSSANSGGTGSTLSAAAKPTASTDGKNTRSAISGESGGGGGWGGRGGSNVSPEIRKKVEDMKRTIASVQNRKQISGPLGSALFQKINSAFKSTQRTYLNDRKF